MFSRCLAEVDVYGFSAVGKTGIGCFSYRFFGGTVPLTLGFSAVAKAADPSHCSSRLEAFRQKKSLFTEVRFTAPLGALALCAS